jgi:predicted  nucleic acid-binding Zn-ribbon protein
VSLKKQVKKADWKTDKILATTSYHQQSGWADSIIENKKYVIYTRKDRKIIRYDKETGEKKKLFQLDKKQNIEDMVTALEIYQNKLYYLNANRLYESDIDGSNRKLVADVDKLKGFEDEIKWI